jgi:hypothetical protein
MEGVRLKTIADHSTLIDLLNLGDFEQWIFNQVSGVNLDTVTDRILESIKGAHPSIKKYTSLHVTFWDNENDPGHFSIALYEVQENHTIHYDENGSIEETPIEDGSDVYTLDSRLLVYLRKPVDSSSSEVRVHYGFIDEIPSDILRLFDQ